MADGKYDGVIIKGVHNSVTESQVLQKIRECFGRKPGFEQWPVKVTVYKVPLDGRTKLVKINGLDLSLREIRIGFAQQSFGKTIIRVLGTDFGLKRDQFGSLNKRQKYLESALYAANGFLHPLNILKEEIEKAFGEFSFLEETIFWANGEDKGFKMGNMKKGGTIIHYNRVVSQRTNVNKTSKTVDYDAYEIAFKYRIEALQTIGAWNHSKDLTYNDTKTKPAVQFITSRKEPHLCRIGVGCTPNFKLGRNNSFLNCEAIMAEFQYIPWDHLNMRIFDQTKIESLKYVCEKCKKKVQLLGIDPDLSWIAARCNCKKEDWKGQHGKEEFFRLTMSHTNRRFYSLYDDKSVAKRKPAIHLLPAMKFVYQNVEDCKAKALNAYKEEFETKREYLSEHATDVMVVGQDLLETVEKKIKGKVKKRRVHFVKAKVNRSKVWSPEGVHKMKHAVIQPPTSAEKTASPFIHAAIYNIEEDVGDKSKCVITLLAYLPDGESMDTWTQFNILPKPPTNQVIAMKRAFSEWEKRVNSGIRKVKGTVKSYSPLNSNDVTNVRIMTVSLEDKTLCSALAERITDSYIGADFSKTMPNKSYRQGTARVTDVCDETCEVELVVSCPGPLSPPEENEITLMFWVIAPSNAQCIFYNPDVQLEPSHVEEEHDFDFDHEEDEDWEFESSERALEKLAKACGYALQIDNHLDWGNEDKEEDETENGNKDEDAKSLDCTKKSIIHHQDFGNLFLTEKKAETFTHFKNNNPSPPNTRKQSIARGIYSILNDSQKAAVDKYMRLPLSMTQGSPGTGKTDTIVVGVTIAHCRKPGLNIVVCPSNRAADVAFEKFLKTNKEHSVGMRITRMIAYSREAQYNAESHLHSPEAVDNWLHTKSRKHPGWGEEKQLIDIMEKSKIDRGARLFSEERNKLHQHRQKISVKILRKTDVLICTAACASDGRLSELLKRLHQSKHYDELLASITVDEASLLFMPAVIPLINFFPQTMWLVGDFNQLPPIATSESARLAGLEISILETMMNTPYFTQNEAFTMLDVQYRMADPISTVVSKFLYEGKIKSSKEVLQRNYHPDVLKMQMPKLLGPNKNMACFTYESFCEKSTEKGGNSFSNPMEVAIAKKLLVRLQAKGISMDKVTIISMYEEQVKLIKYMINYLGLKFNNVRNGTVDSEQGNENDYILLSMVRSNKKNEVGFLSDPRRMNVAISRARDFLFVITDLKTLKGSQSAEIHRLFDLFYRQQMNVAKCEMVDDDVKITEVTPLETMKKE